MCNHLHLTTNVRKRLQQHLTTNVRKMLWLININVLCNTVIWKNLFYSHKCSNTFELLWYYCKRWVIRFSWRRKNGSKYYSTSISGSIKPLIAEPFMRRMWSGNTASPHFHYTGNNPAKNSFYGSGSIAAQKHLTFPGDFLWEEKVLINFYWWK